MEEIVKKNLLITGIIVIVSLGSFSFGSRVFAQNGSGSDSNPASLGSAAQSSIGTDSNPTGKPEVVIPQQYQPNAVTASNASPVSTLYFTPQDENTSTTVLFLYNTTSTDANVSLQSYYTNGSLTINTTIAVPAMGMVRICSDAVTTVAASWASTVLINFTTFSAYAKLTLPAGVKVDGYIAWDTTGAYDPLTSLQTLPLRFVSGSTNFFLPFIQH